MDRIIEPEVANVVMYVAVGIVTVIVAFIASGGDDVVVISIAFYLVVKQSWVSQSNMVQGSGRECRAGEKIINTPQQ